jgi:DNA helicase-2/ATP-dependent DNA helicase PcrA
MSDPLYDDPLDSLDETAPAPAAQAAPAGPPPYLANLNEAQREATEALDGPVLVLAGAGTGKTRVLTTRLAHLLFTGRARPWQVLAVTFTNKAAREMRERVARLVGPASEALWLGTFHSLGVRILRRHAELAGLKSGFTILDTDDQVRLLKQIILAHDVDEKRWPARVLAGIIQGWKDRGLNPDKISAAQAGDFANGKAAEIYAEYQERLSVLNAADFGDLLLHCLNIFQSHPEVLEDYQKQFQYILVDEYQDTNVSQYLWLRLLAQKNKNICCVGDDDQSIYGWRGAEVGNILRFEKDFPGAKVIRLERNYRSTPHILAAASHLIGHNEGRLGKTLWTEEDEGDKLQVRGVWDGETEAREIGEEIEALQNKGGALNEMAILVRAGHQTREFEERMLTLGLPYRVIGGPRFYEREEIRDAIAYFRVIQQPDDDLAFERIVNKPTRGVGPATMQALHGLARATGVSLTAAAHGLMDTDELKPAAKRNLTAILDNFARWRDQADTLTHTELAGVVLDESGYTAMWRTSKNPQAPGKLDNLKELVVGMAERESLAEFLEHVSLVMENDERAETDKVSIMTLHAAKGLEFDNVFLPGWEEGLFPHQRAMDETGAAGLEEERRLAYVGLTRARRRVRISFAANRRIYNQWQSAIPSRFIDELPPDHVESAGETGLYGGNLAPTASEAFSHGSWTPTRRGAPPAGPVIEGTGARTGDDADGFMAGDRCFHLKFGMGTVRSVEGDKLTIQFDKAGDKKVVAAFVEKP